MLKWLSAKFGSSKLAHQTQLEPTEKHGEDAPALADSTAWRKQGNAYLNDDNLAEAESCYRKGILADPEDPICYSNLGYVLVELRRWAEAEEMLIQAVERNPGDFDAHYLLGNLANNRNEWLLAIRSYRKALAIRPDFDLCRRDLCIALAQSGQPKEAQLVMSQGPAFGADTVNFHYFSGNLHLETGNYAAAAASFTLAKQLKPNEAVILLNLSTAQIRLGDFFSAMQNCRSILAIEPDNAQAYANLAGVYSMQGQCEQAVEHYRSALRINPQYMYVRQNLLFELTYVPNLSPDEYLREAETYGEFASARAKPYSDWLCPTQSMSGRPLRVGFVSADLCLHPVGMFLANVLAAVDPTKVTCVAYSNLVTEDAFSEQLKKLFLEWNRVSFLTDMELAQKIHADSIDVLVDLSGHTGQTRLPVFAWRPAPVQVAWLGYWASTGVAEMDYILVDRTSVHEDEAKHYSEAPWYLPDTRFCFSPPVTVRPVLVNDLPALHNEYVTFASYQALNKINDAVLTIWSQVLRRVPSARLRLHGLPLSHEATISDFKRRLVHANIDLDRVDLVGRVLRDDYLESYAKVDVVLDTFPYPGGTTTAEALWMGVPTLSLTGNTLLARQGESMLRCIGLDDWVATSEQDYLYKAVAQVADLSNLAKLRTGLRDAALASPLFDAVRFARNLEQAFEGMTKRQSKSA